MAHEPAGNPSGKNSNALGRDQGYYPKPFGENVNVNTIPKYLKTRLEKPKSVWD